jgi:metal-dependent amidase/aminoacylase/carboxypeptidase family protein
MATLRATTDAALERFAARLRRLAADIAATWELEVELRDAEPFPGTDNHPEVVSAVLESARSLAMELVEPDRPFSWSEDFGHFGQLCPSALIGLGAGTSTPALHHPLYDFPDALLPLGATLLDDVIRRLMHDDV